MNFQGLIFAFILELLLLIWCWLLQFNSFIDPFSILIALPFSISGAFIALYFTGQTLNVYSMIGLIY